MCFTSRENTELNRTQCSTGSGERSSVESLDQEKQQRHPAQRDCIKSGAILTLNVSAVDWMSTEKRACVDKWSSSRLVCNSEVIHLRGSLIYA